MKVLFWAGHTNHISVLLDEAICLHKEGNDVFFMHNLECYTGICSGNMWHNSLTCEICKRRMKSGLRQLPHSIETISIGKFWEYDDFKMDYRSVEDIKKLEYKGVKIGYAMLSSYISSTRNLYPLIDDDAKKYFDNLITSSCRLTDAIERALDTLQPDMVCYWNSRYYDSRPVYDLAKQKGIVAVTFDRTNDVGRRNCKNSFINTTPHSPRGRQALCDAAWYNAPFTTEEKIRIGEDFFIKRRNGLPTNDKIYISEQQPGLLPNNWDDNMRNIVIFNSSEDEFAAIGDEFEQLALFKTQYRGIKFIAEKLKDERNIHIYVRVHPNLKNISYRYHSELANLEKQYANLTVIPASAAISTYALMDAAEKIVVFGSTTGLESAYWGKPVIQLAGAWHYYTDLYYKPKTKEELDILLRAKLPPKNNIDAIKWGFYFMYRDPKDFANFIDIDKEWFGFGKHKWEDIHCFKLFGSSKLFALYSRMLTRYYRKHITCIDVPTAEDPNAEL